MNITEAELAQRLRISPRAAADKRRELGWPHIRIGVHRLYTPDQVAAIEASLTVREKPAEKNSVLTLPGQTPRSAARN